LKIAPAFILSSGREEQDSQAMSRIANERTIFEITSIIRDAQPQLDANSWVAGGATVRRERHRYSGQTYGFLIEITDISFSVRGQCKWHLIVVSEQWQEPGHGGMEMRNSNWLKLMKGSNSDVTQWIRENRPLWSEPPEQA
jgi:hypothetical protein